MRATVLSVLVAAAFAASVALAQPQVSGAVATAPGQAKAVSVITAEATVTAVDAATRNVTLKLKDGKTRTITAGDEVRNFDQIKVGDTVKAKYIESVSIELKKDGKAVLGQTQRGSLERAAMGEKPGGVMVREVTAVAEVVNVDTPRKLVSVKNDKGDVFDLQVKDPEQLKLVKKGDQVQATYTEALAIGLEPAAKPAKK
jgi:hypothetical protein